MSAPLMITSAARTATQRHISTVYIVRASHSQSGPPCSLFMLVAWPSPADVGFRHTPTFPSNGPDAPFQLGGTAA